MKAEIIAIGTELLVGDVVNTNAAWISQRLAELGVDVYHHATVGDNPARIKLVVAQAVERSDLLIFTGGLGPTDDDLTIATLADAFGTKLVNDPESEATIRTIFGRRGIHMPDSNLKQAYKPAGAETIKNPFGTAPGIAWDVSQQSGKPTYLMTFPGVPKELFAMWEQGETWIRRWQADAGEKPESLFTQYLHFVGISESGLGELLSDLMSAANPTVAPYVGQGSIRIRLAAKAPNQAQADAIMGPVKTEILNRAGKYYFGDDNTTLEACVAALLTQKGLSLSLAESCTGGLISNRLTDVPGSSAFTFINMVTYGNTEKTRFINVHPESITQHGAVSPQVAVEMAVGIRAQSHCDIGLSITGIAGPAGGSEEKPIGLAYIGICGPDKVSPTIVKKVLVNANYSRQDVKFWFSQQALYFLLRHLRGELESDFPEIQ